MSSRRSFLKQSGTAAASILFAPSLHSLFAEAAAKHAAGLQLFTLFGIIEKDVPGSLEKIAAAGYKELESAFSRLSGYYGMSATEFKSLAASKGLSWVSHHVLGAPFKLPPGAKLPNGADGKPISIPKMINLKENQSEIVEEIAATGVPYLVCANIPLNNAAEIDEAISILAKTGEACNKAGVQLCYHNHEAEFKEVEGRIPYDVMLSSIPADHLKMELDLGWATHAGIDVVELFKKHPGRFPLWHVKDIDKATGKPVELGAGYIDYKPYFAAADIAGMKHFFVEQDGAPKPFDNIKNSFDNLQKML